MKKWLFVLGLLFMAACGDTDTARSFLAPSWLPAITAECDAWDASTTYNGGSTVIYESQGYEAKWWSQGDTPAQSGQWGVWKTTEACEGGAPAPNPDPEPEPPVPNPNPNPDPPAPEPNPDPTCTAEDFRVVGYSPSWQGSANDIQYDKLTHINYSFLLPNSDGSLQSLANAGKLQAIVSRAKTEGVKVLIAVGGWNGGNDSAFTTLAANESSRSAFIDNLMDFVERYDLDGVDMDWEYPKEGSEPQDYEMLMEELGNRLHAEGKLLTAAVIVSGYYGDGILDGVFDDIDFLNIMAYDGNDHASMAQAEGGLDYWLGAVYLRIRPYSVYLFTAARRLLATLTYWLEALTLTQMNSKV